MSHFLVAAMIFARGLHVRGELRTSPGSSPSTPKLDGQPPRPRCSRRAPTRRRDRADRRSAPSRRATRSGTYQAAHVGRAGHLRGRPERPARDPHDRPRCAHAVPTGTGVRVGIELSGVKEPRFVALGPTRARRGLGHDRAGSRAGLARVFGPQGVATASSTLFFNGAPRGPGPVVASVGASASRSATPVRQGTWACFF